MKQLFYLFTLLCCLACVGLAQTTQSETAPKTDAPAKPDKPDKPDKSDTKLPDKVSLTADETNKIRLVQLRLATLARDVQTLREQLTKTEEQAKREQEDLNAQLVKVLAKHGLKADDLGKYEFRNAALLDTEPIHLVKKPDAPSVPAPAKP